MPDRIHLPDREICEAYRQGVSQGFLAEYFEVSIMTIRSRLAKYGLTKPAKKPKPPVPGPNAWLNALTETERMRIESLVIEHERWRKFWLYLMTHPGGPGYFARQRGTQGSQGRDPETKTLHVSTHDVHDDLYRGMPRCTPCRRSFDGGKTWQPFEPIKFWDEGSKPRIKGKKNQYRKDAARDLRDQGLMPGTEQR